MSTEITEEKINEIKKKVCPDPNCTRFRYDKSVDRFTYCRLIKVNDKSGLDPIIEDCRTVSRELLLYLMSDRKGKFPSGRPKTIDLLNTVQPLSSLLTVGNLDVMSGVLSESDMKVIKGLANDIGIKFGEGEEANTSKGFSGSVEATVTKLRTLKKEIAGRLRRQGYGLEGDIISNPDTGQRMQFINKEWVAL